MSRNSTYIITHKKNVTVGKYPKKIILMHFCRTMSSDVIKALLKRHNFFPDMLHSFFIIDFICNKK